MIDDKLNFTDHITKTAQSCRFALYNIKKIRPFLSEHATQLLVRALVLSRLDYCNALLAGLPASSIKPLQLIQNAAVRLIFNEPKRTHVTPLFINLHWLPIAARIKFKALMFAYRTTSGSAPLYLNSLLQTYMPSRSLRSASERRIHPKEAQNHFHRLFHLPFPSGRMTCLTQSEQLNPYHRQETAKNTYLPSLFNPLTLPLSILNLFDLICLLFIKKKNTNI